MLASSTTLESKLSRDTKIILHIRSYFLSWTKHWHRLWEAIHNSYDYHDLLVSYPNLIPSERRYISPSQYHKTCNQIPLTRIIKQWHHQKPIVSSFNGKPLHPFFPCLFLMFQNQPNAIRYISWNFSISPTRYNFLVVPCRWIVR